VADVRIDQAFVSAFIAGNFNLPIAHENLPYEPIAGTAYAAINVLQNDTTPRSLNSSDQTDGVFRVILHYPVNGGAMAAKNKAADIFATFKIAAQFCYGGACATVVAHQRQPGVAEDGWHKIVADIRYRAFITRGN
jgi:hypothetical protein